MYDAARRAVVVVVVVVVSAAASSGNVRRCRFLVDSTIQQIHRHRCVVLVWILLSS